MKKLAILLCCIICDIAYAQNYYVHDVLELTNDLTARRKSVKDADGKGCALIRVSIPSVNNIDFNSSIVGDPELLPGEYSVFLPESSDNLSLSVNGERYLVDFSNFNITIEDKKCYRVVFTKKVTPGLLISKTKITANYDNVVILIDGVPVGQTPLQLDNIPLGKHLLSVPNTNGVTMRDTTVVFTSNNRIHLTLHQEPRKAVYVDMATPGGDSAGWYNVFGTNVKEENGKKGIVDYAGNTIVPCIFDDIYPGIQNGYYVVVNDGKEGLYDAKDGQVVPCVYNSIVTTKSYNHHAYMPVVQDRKWGVISPDGDLIVPIKYENYPKCYTDAIVVEYEEPGYEEAYGVFSYDGTEMIKPKYCFLNAFVDGYAIFLKFDRTIGFTDIYGNETNVPNNYSVGTWGDAGAVISSDLFRVRENSTGKWGYMNSKLELIIPCIYDPINKFDDAPNFNNGIVALKLNENKLVLDPRGNVVVDCKDQGYNDIEVVYLSDESWRGSFCTYESYFGAVDNTLIKVVNANNKCGLLDTTGEIVVPCEYEEENIQWFCDNGVDYFVVLDDDERIVFDKQQSELIRLPSNLSICEILDGFIMIKDVESGSYGYLNLKGEVLANCIYGYNFEVDNQLIEESSAEEDGYNMAELMSEQPISEGFAILNIGDRFGFIDNKGDVRVPLIYTAVTPFENGVSYVRRTDGVWKKIYKSKL